MRFIDEVQIMIQSGHGGMGCVSFRRERFIPKGGPDGGDGGRGGDVVFRVLTKKSTLYHLKFNNQFRAGNGHSGQGARKAGKAGKDVIIDVPAGTLVIDSDTGCVLRDLVNEGDFFVAATGGKGGRGNRRFKSSTNRTPRFAQPGELGCVLDLRLELKLLADVGIVGLPNAGKSTLLSALSSARPKIGGYPFTTLVPNLGVVSVVRAEPFVVADIPGLIEGAHEGLGLGVRFLKHIERTNILLHLIDVGQIDLDDPFAGVEIIDRELAFYSDKLISKPRLFVLNKVDLSSIDKAVKFFKAKCNSKDFDFLCVSAITGEGIHNLISKLTEMLANLSDRL